MRRRRAGLVPIAAASISATLAGCRAADHPTEQPVAPAYAPPPADGAAIDRDEALSLARDARDPEDAIHALDRRRFRFKLDRPTLRWFREQGMAPEVVDYLEKRRGVDYDGTRGDVDPDTPGRRTR